jgi:hypothetical protein
MVKSTHRIEMKMEEVTIVYIDGWFCDDLFKKSMQMAFWEVEIHKSFRPLTPLVDKMQTILSFWSQNRPFPSPAFSPVTLTSVPASRDAPCHETNL